MKNEEETQISSRVGATWCSSLKTPASATQVTVTGLVVVGFDYWWWYGVEIMMMADMVLLGPG